MSDEAPCEVTGKPCRWLSDDQYDDKGELASWDLFCTDCFRSREWENDEAATSHQPKPTTDPA